MKVEMFVNHYSVVKDKLISWYDDGFVGEFDTKEDLERSIENDILDDWRDWIDVEREDVKIIVSLDDDEFIPKPKDPKAPIKGQFDIYGDVVAG